MNKQGKIIDGKVIGGIEWVKTIHPDGTETQGYTWNPIAGCQHGCEWTMPDGAVAQCYAETQAEGYALSAHYPQGFAHHYWHPHRLDEPGRVKTGARIFVGSMADVFGHWVPEHQIKSVLEVAAATPQHTFIFLTKNLKRAKQFAFSANCWVGTSTPPDAMFGKPLRESQQFRLFKTALETMADLKQQGVTTWISAEPLSWDISGMLDLYGLDTEEPIMDWMVIGAASNGAKYHPPAVEHFENTLAWLDFMGVPVFFKGNLRSLSEAAADWREDFPTSPPTLSPEMSTSLGEGSEAAAVAGSSNLMNAPMQLRMF